MEIFNFSKDADEMNEGELRATLVDLVAKHNEQVEATDDYAEQIDALEGDVETYKADASTAVAFFSELVASQKDMDAETLADRFNAEELQEMVDMDAFSQNEESEAEAEEDESTFAEKTQKSDDLPGEEDDLAQYRSDARSALERMGVAKFE